MPRYEVKLEEFGDYKAHWWVEVEANSPEEAIDIAYDTPVDKENVVWSYERYDQDATPIRVKETNS